MKRLIGVLLLLALLGAVVAKLVFFDFPRIGGDDMAPAVQAGDWLLSSRRETKPARGALVLIEHPQQQRLIVRRVVGLPGERVAVVQETPIIDGRRAARTQLQDVMLIERRPLDVQQQPMKLLEERIGELRYRVLKDPTRRSVDASEVLLQDAYYVMADNRNHGTDSRTFGPVPASNIRGVITHRLLGGQGSIGDQPPRAGWTRIE